MGSKPQGYSASRISAIIGLNKYQTIREAWQVIKEEQEPGFNAKHGYRLPIFEGNAATRWGHAFEDPIIKLAEEREGCEIISREGFFQSPSFSGVELTCHVDGLFKKMERKSIVEENGRYMEKRGIKVPPEIHEGKTTNIMAYNQRTDEKLRWGKPGTDEVPEEYQVQTAVQRICTGADLVKLSVLVFPKAVDDFEALGWKIVKGNGNQGMIDQFFIIKGSELGMITRDPLNWARLFSDIGNFHTYNLPKNEALESAIIETVTEIHHKNILPGIPPEPKDYDDIRRLLTRPMGTIIANEELALLCSDYSEVTRQLGEAGPMQKRKKDLRLDILKRCEKLKRDNWNEPNDKLVVISPDGGTVLATFGVSESGKQSFRTKRA